MVTTINVIVTPINVIITPINASCHFYKSSTLQY
jgi:hypothetical protein